VYCLRILYLLGTLQMSQESSKKSETSVDKEILAAFENFDMSAIKKAGSIFDGFCVSSFI
jgi:hypothetical protein